MKKINWVQIRSKPYGGNVYREELKKILEQKFDLTTNNIEAKYLRWRYLKPLEWFSRLLNLKGEADLWIRDDFFSLVALPFDRTKGKTLFLNHHIDFSVFPFFTRLVFVILEKIFYRVLKKTDAIVTVSDYWEDYFLKKGYNNVFKIYNAFNVPEYNFQNEEIAKFKKKYNLEEKPIIYIGNCQRAKGVLETYQALKDLDVYLVTSGERMVNIPTLNLVLEHRDYLKLLKASSVVVAASKFKEGWCRTCHEAMLLKTPVIGSGLGGMKELLEGGKQIICPEFNLLREKVEYLLDRPEIRIKMGEAGHNFAKNFTLEKFKSDWLLLINKLL